MKIWPLISLVAVPIFAQSAPSLLVTPVGSPGNSENAYPFLIFQTSSMRYQQVFTASSFSEAAPNGGMITRLWFVSDGNSQFGCCYDADIHSIQINLSTTSRAVDSLSPVFADNVGLNDTIVFPRNGLEFFGYVDLTQPFLYEPTKGNLLLDVRLFSGVSSITTWPPLDAQDALGDPISRAYASGVESTTATRGDSRGLLTAFSITPVPDPSILSIFAAAAAIAISVRLWRTNGKQTKTTTAEKERKEQYGSSIEATCHRRARYTRWHKFNRRDAHPEGEEEWTGWRN